MKLLNKAFISLFTSLVLLGGCGSSNNKNDKKINQEAILLDAFRTFNLNLGSALVAKASDSQVLWSIELYVEGSMQSLQISEKRISFTKLVELVSKISVRLGDEIDIKLTAENEAGEVLATNMEYDASKTELTKKMWNSQCSNSADSRIVIDLEGLRSGKFVLGSDGKQLNLSLRLCDFTNLLVAPVVHLKPQPAMELHNVVFQCVGESSKSSYSVGIFEKPTCRIGYRPEQGASIAVSNMVPMGTDISKEFKPEISSRLESEAGRQQYTLYLNLSDLSQLPYFARKDAGCQKMEVVLYEFANPSKEYRLKYKYNGKNWFVENDLGKRPTVTNPSTVEFFLHCYWRAEARAGSTVSIPFSN